ncbi:MAG TPA: amylo-alpha-1,6-glucosidase [Xanthobacteraceae bacterium]|nr:amylo-alpha-1,6-glucosidase [Xanthobacteraceae bacterium]
MKTPGAETIPHASAPAEVVQLAQFFIPAAASLHERRPRTLKHGDTFGVFDHNGDVLSGPGSPEGLYHRDTRHLSHLYVTVGDARPILLSSTLRDDNATLTCDLANPDLYDSARRLTLEHDLIHIRRSRFLWNAAWYERLALRNFDDRVHRVRLKIAFAADFADLFEVRGARRARRGEYLVPLIEKDAVTLGYIGLDGRRRTTRLRFDPPPQEVTGDAAVYDLSLAPGKIVPLFLAVSCDIENGVPHEQPVRRSFLSTFREARRALHQSASRAASIVTSNDLFNEAVRRSVSDIYMLITDTPSGPYPYAGIPWFSTVFGRDALISAWEMLWLDPAIARGVLRYLALQQAKDIDPAADAQPGKILHEVRQGEMAELGEVPFRRYYGSVDSTPLFVYLAGAYLERTGDVETLKELWPAIEAALAWIDTYGDIDGDGFVEYSRQTADGLINQGWKDSHDSVFHADGALARGPIALAEVQAYVYGAWLAAVEIVQRLGQPHRAAALQMRAETLRKRFDEVFFDEALGTYVLALDGDKRPCRVRSSNAGHALLTGLAYPERAKSVVANLMHAHSFSGWGVRTLASSEPRYNPMSYHNGSVWPHDNALIAAGFSRYGFRREAARIFEGLFEASAYIDLRRMPELFCGFARQRAQGPTFYPVACSPQAWAAAAPLCLLRACLGLGFDPESLYVTFDEPTLPEFLDEVVVRRLSIRDQSVDVALRRSQAQVVVDVLERRGPVRVIIRN